MPVLGIMQYVCMLIQLRGHMCWNSVPPPTQLACWHIVQPLTKLAYCQMYCHIAPPPTQLRHVAPGQQPEVRVEAGGLYRRIVPLGLVGQPEPEPGTEGWQREWHDGCCTECTAALSTAQSP